MYTLEDTFEDVVETPLERNVRLSEERVYRDPNGWRFFLGAAIKDINIRLHRWNHLPLTDNDIKGLALTIQDRMRNGMRPAWSEELSEIVVQRALDRDGSNADSKQVEADVVASAGEQEIAEAPDGVDEAMSEEDSDAVDGAFTAEG